MRLHVIVTPMVVLFVAARIFIRLRLESRLRPDDYAIVAAGVTYVGAAAMAFPVTMKGYGQHTWYLSIADLTLALKVSASRLFDDTC